MYVVYGVGGGGGEGIGGCTDPRILPLDQPLPNRLLGALAHPVTGPEASAACPQFEMNIASEIKAPVTLRKPFLKFK